MAANTESWQSILDCEIIKHAEDKEFLQNMQAVLKAKSESIQILIEYPEFKAEIIADVRSQKLLVPQIPQ